MAISAAEDLTYQDPFSEMTCIRFLISLSGSGTGGDIVKGDGLFIFRNGAMKIVEIGPTGSGTGTAQITNSSSDPKVTLASFYADSEFYVTVKGTK